MTCFYQPTLVIMIYVLSFVVVLQPLGQKKIGGKSYCSNHVTIFR